MTSPRGAANTAEQLLSIVIDLIRDAPEFAYEAPITEKEMRWLGRAEAVLTATGLLSDLLSFRTARERLNTYRHSKADLLQPLYNALSHLELKVPSSMQGAFIPSGDTWNGYTALVKLVQRDCDQIMVVDPYLNADIYLHFAPHILARQGLRCLATKQNQSHAGLVATKTKWDADPMSQSHPVEVRYAPERTLHDRLIIIDGREVWLVSQSIKDVAKRSPASVSRTDNETALLKAQHYSELWDQSISIS